LSSSLIALPIILYKLSLRTDTAFFFFCYQYYSGFFIGFIITIYLWNLHMPEKNHSGPRACVHIYSAKVDLRLLRWPIYAQRFRRRRISVVFAPFMYWKHSFFTPSYQWYVFTTTLLFGLIFTYRSLRI